MTTTNTKALETLGAGSGRIRRGKVRSYLLVAGQRVVRRDAGYGMTAVVQVSIEGEIGAVLGVYYRDGGAWSTSWLDRADRVRTDRARTAKGALELIARHA